MRTNFGTYVETHVKIWFHLKRMYFCFVSKIFYTSQSIDPHSSTTQRPFRGCSGRSYRQRFAAWVLDDQRVFKNYQKHFWMLCSKFKKSFFKLQSIWNIHVLFHKKYTNFIERTLLPQAACQSSAVTVTDAEAGWIAAQGWLLVA